MDEDSNDSQSKVARANRPLQCFLAAIIFLEGVCGVARTYAVLGLLPSKPFSQWFENLSAEERDEIERRKNTLDVAGLPYAPTSAIIVEPIPNESLLHPFKTEFVDESTGLVIRAETHLCLPGIDPCVSGGRVEVADNDNQWSIEFRLLGADRPSRFQSQMPRSQSLLNKLRGLAGDVSNSTVTQANYRSALQSALAAQKDSAEQKSALVQLVRLLIASFLASEEFSDTMQFAKQHSLIR